MPTKSKSWTTTKVAEAASAAYAEAPIRRLPRKRPPTAPGEILLEQHFARRRGRPFAREPPNRRLGISGARRFSDLSGSPRFRLRRHPRFSIGSKCEIDR